MPSWRGAWLSTGAALPLPLSWYYPTLYTTISQIVSSLHDVRPKFCNVHWNIGSLFELYCHCLKLHLFAVSRFFRKLTSVLFLCRWVPTWRHSSLTHFIIIWRGSSSVSPSSCVSRRAYWLICDQEQTGHATVSGRSCLAGVLPVQWRPETAFVFS
jgi:hypothetical protein